LTGRYERVAGRTALGIGALVALALLPAQPLAARQADAAAAPAGGWNDARVMALVERGRERRQQPVADASLTNYRALAEGSIYFYIDPDAADPVLMRADQVAVELYWAHPDRTRQILLGQRIEKRLPIRDFQYYIDRLTVIQGGFSDEIRVGEGMDVRDVVHPLAARAELVYDYRLADSLVLRLPGSPPIRAYEIVVRPKRPDLPGFVGSIFIDDATGSLVRMAFSFTRASYADARNDFVRITLDHGLWQGRYWLPNEQQVIVRRELPELDLGAGTIIRATLRVSEYDFDVDLPPNFFLWPSLAAVPREQRAAYPFRRGMYDDLVRDGLRLGGDIRAVETEARRLLREQMLSGLPRTRPSVPNASGLLRYNRVEGLFVGSGMRTTLDGADVVAHAGYAVAAERPAAAVELRVPVGAFARLDAGLHLRELRDVGPQPGAPGVLNTLATAFAGRDYLDPFFASGGRLRVSHGLRPGAAVRVEGRVERHRAGTLNVADAPVGGRAMRPVLPLDDGTLAGLSVRLDAGAPAYRGMRPQISTTVEGGFFENEAFGAIEAGVAVSRTAAQLAGFVEARADAGVVVGGAPLQRHYFLGGPGTLPGHAYRSHVGSHFALVSAEASRTVRAPWVDVRAFAAAGWAGGPLPDGAQAGFSGGPERGSGVIGSIGVGGAFVHRVLRIDVVHGLGAAGRAAIVLSVDPRLRPWL
jgi:hypothetical protein